MDKVLDEFRNMLDGETDYLPAERVGQDDLQNLLSSFKETLFSVPLIDSILNSIEVQTIVVNRSRQIVYANKSFQEAIGMKLGDFLGARPGEVISCNNAITAPSGCGTNDNCKGCTLVNSLEKTYTTGEPQSCNFDILNSKHEQVSFKIYFSRFENVGEDYVICTLLDTKEIQNSKIMENIFIHDVKNNAGVLQSCTEFLGSSTEFDENEFETMVSMVARVSTKVLDEINSYQEMLSLKNGEVKLNSEEFDVIFQIKLLFEELSHIFKDKKIDFNLESEKESIVLSSDRILFSRAMMNVLKNAIEASTSESCQIGITIKSDGGNVVLKVKNDAVIPIEIQRSLFNRTTTTKGMGRGYGAFSIKLLVERFLKGGVSLISNERDRTVVTVSIPSL